MYLTTYAKLQFKVANPLHKTEQGSRNSFGTIPRITAGVSGNEIMNHARTYRKVLTAF